MEIKYRNLPTETSNRGKLQTKWAEGSHAAIPLGRRWGKCRVIIPRMRGRILEVPSLLDDTFL